MKRIFFVLIGVLPLLSMSEAGAAVLSVARIFDSPELDGDLLLKLQFSPHGDRLSFLRPKPSNYEILDLWEYNLKSGMPRALIDSDTLKFTELSEEEKSRRERMRESRQGIVEYKWFHDGARIVLPAAGDLYLYTLKNKQLRRLTRDVASEIDVQVSPDDSFISFVRDQNLYLLETKTTKIHAVTSDGKGAVSNGVAEFVAQEEMARFTGYWWSKDGKYLAFTRVDENPVKVVDRYDIQADKVVVRKERYPEAGTNNAIVQLAVVKVADIVNGRPRPQWVNLGKNKDFYLANADWNSDGRLIYQIQSRDQKKLDVYSYDPSTRHERRLFVESDPKWVNLHGDTKMLEKSPRWVWASERTGFKHLYLYKNDGTELYALTTGAWPVDHLVGIDEVQGWVYFTASKETPLERHVYRVALEKPDEPELLTRDEGWSKAIMSEKGDVFVHFFSSPLSPPQVYLHKSDGTLISALSANNVKEGHPLFPYKDSLVAPEFGSMQIPSGEKIYYRLYKPKNFDAKRKYPLIVFGYGGPQAQVVTKSWIGKTGLFVQTLLAKGFLVASFDNRGSANRGKNFENYLYRAFGTVEVADQVAGVQHLISQGFVDPDRTGFFGWSFGGYLSMSLAVKAPGVFKAYVVGAPVTDFALYDTHYTERYLGDPNKEPDVYKRASTLSSIANLTGDILVMHGMADDNVLFANSTLLFKELQKAGKIYESVTYPGAKHGVNGKENQVHLYTTISNFFERRLRPELPAAH